MQFCAVLLALTAALLLALSFIRFSVPTWIRKKFPHIFKQRKANRAWGDGEAGHMSGSPRTTSPECVVFPFQGLDRPRSSGLLGESVFIPLSILQAWILFF